MEEQLSKLMAMMTTMQEHQNRQEQLSKEHKADLEKLSRDHKADLEKVATISRNKLRARGPCQTPGNQLVAVHGEAGQMISGVGAQAVGYGMNCSNPSACLVNTGCPSEQDQFC